MTGLEPLRYFKDFVAAHDNGYIDNDAAWRAYDIQRLTYAWHFKDAAKFLGYAPPISSLTAAQIAAEYGLLGPDRAKALLSAWWVWRQIALGRKKPGRWALKSAPLRA